MPLVVEPMMFCVPSTRSLAADNAKVEKKGETTSSKKKDDKKLPHRKILNFLTDDGLRLTLTYYPGTKGKETVPIVLLHMWKQSRVDYKDLALFLQSKGHAVIVPDLRGHGQSTRSKAQKR